MSAPDVMALDPSQLTPEQAAYLSSPKGFAKHVLGIPYYDTNTGRVLATCRAKDGSAYYEVKDNNWQEQVLDAINPHGSRVSVITCNGAGKTAVILATAILWHLSVFPNCRVVSTSGAWRQLRSQLWPALMAQRSKLGEDWEFIAGDMTVRSPIGGEYVGFSTNDEGKAEGYHGSKIEDYFATPAKGPLMIIVDEAKTVPLGVFQAFDRCTYQRLLYISSGGGAEGPFYDSQKPTSNFTKFRVPASLCPHADHEKNAEMIAKWGLDHPLIRSTIFSEFMTSADNAVLDMRDIERAMNAKPGTAPSYPVASLDFAAGGDENVLAIAEGNAVRIPAAWTETDTVRAAGRFVSLLREAKIPAEQAWGDAEGLGTAVMDSMAALGMRIRRHLNGDWAKRDDVYLNAGAEMWGEFAAALRKGEVVLPRDHELAAQLAARKWKPGTPRLQLESKGDMRRRGVTSPDRADAVIMAWYHKTPTVNRTNSIFTRPPDDDENPYANTMRGAFAGAV